MKKFKIIFTVLAVLVLGFIANVASLNHNEDVSVPVSIIGEHDNFAKCLTEKGVKLYTTSWCPHCKNQKELFGDSLQYLSYYECDLDGSVACEEAGVTGVPAWKFPGKEELVTGTRSLEAIAELSGCTL